MFNSGPCRVFPSREPTALAKLSIRILEMFFVDGAGPHFQFNEATVNKLVQLVEGGGHLPHLEEISSIALSA